MVSQGSSVYQPISDGGVAHEGQAAYLVARGTDRIRIAPVTWRWK